MNTVVEKHSLYDDVQVAVLEFYASLWEGLILVAVSMSGAEMKCLHTNTEVNATNCLLSLFNMMA